MQVYPSIIAADLLYLGREIKILDPYCAGFHIDIMDGHFVPNLAFGTAAAEAIDAASQHPSWIHLMVDNPSFFIKNLNLKPGGLISFHLETKADILQTVLNIREKKWLASLALNPKTPIEDVLPFLEMNIDHILLMTVEPGFSGQDFIPEVLQKIPALLEQKEKKQLSFSIGLDGGISINIMDAIKLYPVQQIVLGSALFEQKDKISILKNI